VSERVANNLMIIFPIKKRMSTDLLIDRTAALKEERHRSEIRPMKGVIELGFSYWWIV